MPCDLHPQYAPALSNSANSLPSKTSLVSDDTQMIDAGRIGRRLQYASVLLRQAYCRGFIVLGAFVARLRSARVSTTISVRPFLPGCSIIVMTSCLPIHSARCASYFMPYTSNTGSV